jgi:hypothetical protein
MEVCMDEHIMFAHIIRYDLTTFMSLKSISNNLGTINHEYQKTMILGEKKRNMNIAWMSIPSAWKDG